MQYHPDDIIRAALGQFRCVKCGKPYAAEGMDLVEVAGYRGVFACSCHACGTSAMVVTGLRDMQHRIARRSDNVEKVSVSKVSPKDVVAMQQFMEGFEGKLTDILTPEAEEGAVRAEEKKKEEVGREGE